MSWFDKINQGVRRWWTGEDRRPRPWVSEEPNPYLRDCGPATRRYLKMLLLGSLARSCMTKKMTRCRTKQMLKFLLRLRPEQREVVYAAGWNKNVFV